MAARNDLRITRNAGGWALLEIVREPVNSMDLALWQQLAAALGELEADPQVRFGSGWVASGRGVGTGCTPLRDSASLPGPLQHAAGARRHLCVRPSARCIYGWQRHQGALCAADVTRALHVSSGESGSGAAGSGCLCSRVGRPAPQTVGEASQVVAAALGCRVSLRHPAHLPSPCTPCSEFWLTSNRFLARLLASPLVTIAAIRGAHRRVVAHGPPPLLPLPLVVLPLLPLLCVQRVAGCAMTRRSLFDVQRRCLVASSCAGACPAGGCALSMCCDYRVMTESGHIGETGS